MSARLSSFLSAAEEPIASAQNSDAIKNRLTVTGHPFELDRQVYIASRAKGRGISRRLTMRCLQSAPSLSPHDHEMSEITKPDVPWDSC